MGKLYSKPQVLESNNKYGWKRDLPDFRDLKHSPLLKNYYDKVIDLRNKCPDVYNQGKLGSCTANAIAGAYEFNEMKEKEDNIFIPSRLFIYYNERQMENQVDTDSGAQIRDGIKSITQQGVCNEKDWPYDVDKFTIQPSEKCYELAKNHKCIKYEKLTQDLEHMKACLYNGYPFVFGFTVYDNFETEEVARSGIMIMPNENSKVLGGHAVMAVGYNETLKMFIIRNSWGPDWGKHGYFYMPYDYISNPDLASDFWVIQKVKDM